MTYSVDNIVQVTTKMVPGGLNVANFGFAALFAPESEAPPGFVADTYRDYTTASELLTDGYLSTDAIPTELANTVALFDDPNKFKITDYRDDLAAGEAEWEARVAAWKAAYWDN